ncbi:stress responsive alpha/beta barrel protein [Pontibacter ummariensis]|uniref:Stress responsive A/B Barrel Domain n=1 Tax=Pontibacter ummariensis TaxID=1610492 RepID=A0A239HNH5_9BACT|nr:Dabb family protein [Pontibacter ummariensis]PRY10354.1 stress responsive alpha/beta barrel protein [Pontibacter ummariensis]SNS82909.1 Stress responsive A/B Barrel Domain [Pontibacter ummariensis]
MFVHHVYFWLKNPEAAAEKARLLEGLKSLQTVETIRTVHIGVPADTDRPVIERGYHFSLLLIFDNKEDHDTYQVHPVHKKFVEDCSSLWSKVVIYDAVDA